MSNSPTQPAQLAERLRHTVLRLYRQLRWQTQAIGMAPQDPILLETIRAHPGVTLS